ncbi:MAG: hypothetical protein OHM56_02045 [Spiroplasma phoeniceum]|nr:MAG: hypothetical protein OHM57_01485 [Spiroplasma phoeniceum]UZQ32763.1 MAG: hypothetical protein OHM56_02045 [Spiroplasma phoeniceum]
MLDKQSIEIIQQNLEDCDEWIFKNYKIKVVRKGLRFWYKKYFFNVIDEFKTLINQDF